MHYLPFSIVFTQTQILMVINVISVKCIIHSLVFARRYMAEILPIWHKPKQTINQRINQSINLRKYKNSDFLFLKDNA